MLVEREGRGLLNDEPPRAGGSPVPETSHLEVVAQVRDGAVWYLSVAMEMGRCVQFGAGRK